MFKQEQNARLGFIATMFLMLAVVQASYAEDFPQWRGPNRDGKSAEKGLLKEWPIGGPKLLWRSSNLGAGYSTPSVSKGRVYLQSNEGNDNEYVQALDEATGKEIWRTRIGKVGNPDQMPQYPAARSTPTIEGDRLYALGSDGDIACLETMNGKIRWSKNVRTEFGGQPGVWAYSESPLIEGNAVICAPGGAEATLLALDKQSGALLWKTAIPSADQAGYASAIAADIGGVRQIVQFLQKGLVGVEASTGKLLWRYERTAQGSPANIPTPVIAEDQVYSGASRSGGGLARIKRNGARFEVEEVYAATRLPTAIGGFVKVGDFLYGFAGPVLQCVEFSTGTVKWEDRSIGTGSVLYADGRLYLHSESNDLALVEPSPDGYREKGRFTPNNAPDRGRSRAWTYPVIANGKLFIRDSSVLWCYDVKGDS